MTKYYFVAASEKFLTVEEPLEEILKERERNYKENKKHHVRFSDLFDVKLVMFLVFTIP